MWLRRQNNYHCPPIEITWRQGDRKAIRAFVESVGWKAQNSVLFPKGDDEGAFTVLALDARARVFSIKDRRDCIGKPVIKLSLFGSGQLVTFVAPDLMFLGFLVMCCNGSSLKPARSLCVGSLFAFPHFHCLGFLCRRVLHFSLSLIRCLTVQDATSCLMDNCSVWMWVDAQCFVMPLLYCSVASAESIL